MAGRRAIAVRRPEVTRPSAPGKGWHRGPTVDPDGPLSYGYGPTGWVRSAGRYGLGPQSDIPGAADLALLWEASDTPQAVLSRDTGRILTANPAWERQLGLAPGGVAGRRWPELVVPAERPTIERALAAFDVNDANDADDSDAGDEAGPRHGSCTLAGSSEPGTTVRWSARPSTDGQRLLLSLAVDRTEAQLHERLRELEQRFRLAMVHAPVGMAISRLDGPWVAVNPALCELFGRSEAELLGGLSFAELTHPDDLAVELPLLDELVAGQRGHYALEKRYRRPDGSEVWTQTVVTLVRDEIVGPRYFVAQCLDLTERRRIEEELRATNERLEQSDGVRLAFLRATSHELRTPLTVVAGLTETLGRVWRQLPAGQVDDLLARMLANTDRLRNLVEDLLDVDRLASGVVSARRRSVPLHRLLRDVLDTVDVDGRELRTELEPITLAVDVPKLERVVVNLVANAARHSPPDGSIWVRCHGRDDTVVLRVDDEGPGIPVGYEDRIFEPFVQAPSRWEDASPGAGLGLTLAREFVALHEGTLRAVNRPDGGARFEVLLPRCPDGVAGTTD